jgi:phosphopantothenoylcysteine decarboxylase/phosphopantothenate--cysteine ligase
MIHARSASQMKDAVLQLFPTMDIVIKAAAVADYRPVEKAPQKIKKKKDSLLLELERTEDILEILGKQKKNQILVGFAAETERIFDAAKDKMARKNLDMIAANDVSSGVFGEDSSTVHILSKSGETTTIQNQSKSYIADEILDRACAIIQRRNAESATS